MPFPLLATLAAAGKTAAAAAAPSLGRQILTAFLVSGADALGSQLFGGQQQGQQQITTPLKRERRRFLTFGDIQGIPAGGQVAQGSLMMDPILQAYFSNRG